MAKQRLSITLRPGTRLLRYKLCGLSEVQLIDKASPYAHPVPEERGVLEVREGHEPWDVACLLMVHFNNDSE